MSWFVMGEFPLEKNLSDLHCLLDMHQIAHRFTEENGVQKLWLSDDTERSEVERLLADYERGELIPDLAEAEFISGTESVSSKKGLADASAILRRVPLTFAFIILGFVGYLAIELDMQWLVALTHFAPFGNPDYQHQYWRLVGPAFLHFDLMHFIFNAVMIWFAGARLEMFLGKLPYLLLFLFCAIAANVAQFVTSGSIAFGGLSGVVYGYVFCNLVLYKRWPLALLSLPPAIYGFLLFTLALGFLGVVDFFIVGRVANWAHLGGLLAGLVYGLAYCLIRKRDDSGS